MQGAGSLPSRVEVMPLRRYDVSYGNIMRSEFTFEWVLIMRSYELRVGSWKLQIEHVGEVAWDKVGRHKVLIATQPYHKPSSRFDLTLILALTLSLILAFARIRKFWFCDVMNFNVQMLRFLLIICSHVEMPRCFKEGLGKESIPKIYILNWTQP